MTIVTTFGIWHYNYCVYINPNNSLLLIALRKKIDALEKEKECELVGKWKKSVINHLYWSAVSTPNGDGEMILAKWISLDNHIHNKHKQHGKLFPVCKHKAIQKKGRKNKWFKPRKFMAYHCVVLQCVTYYCFYIDTKASEKLSSIIQNRRFCGDVKKLSPLYQTSACEAFHSVVINFAPKSTAFTYNGMLSR